MAKVKRSVLKQLIKECLVEILVEGISADSNTANALVEAVTPQPSSSRKTQSLSKHFESEVERINKQREKLDSRRPTQINENAINALTEDPMMADIFRDTAQTTLQDQGMSNNVRGSAKRVAADAASQAVANNELEDLFEGAGNWAALAFGNNTE